MYEETGSGSLGSGLGIRLTQLNSGSQTYVDYDNVRLDFSAVPEPATIVLFGIGLAGFVGVSVRRRFKKAIQ